MTASLSAALVSTALVGLAAMALSAPMPAQASAKVATQPLVECLLPGQVRTGANGVPTMGPRRIARLTAAECQVRGGEYTVAVAKAPPPAARKPEDLVIVNCLLPAQLRQLGSKASYVKVLRPMRLARWDCKARGGESVTAARYQSAQANWTAAVARSKK
ncbi:hypothetical protein [Arenimonas sp.]|uniref:hypothetical protein n=1 Tax=Arenimonas sp. TaxID=1872635 RepID=UPI0039E362E5